MFFFFFDFVTIYKVFVEVKPMFERYIPNKASNESCSCIFEEPRVTIAARDDRSTHSWAILPNVMNASGELNEIGTLYKKKRRESVCAWVVYGM